MASETIPLLQLMQTKGLGPRSLSRLLDRLEKEQLSLHDFMGLAAEEKVARFGLDQEQADFLLENRETAVQIAEQLDEHRIGTLQRASPGYPQRLKTVLADKAPPILFVGGAADLLQQRGVGFCGARDASEDALRCADELARTLAKKGFLLVSGHAQGADEIAHRAALEVGGATAIVLPEGIFHFRPRPSIAELLADDNYVVVSEFPPKMPWSVSNAMQRNRTICGLVETLIVVEAGTSGGTWEAGLEALRLRVPLFVLEFPDPAPSAPGNALLVKKGGVPLPCQPGEKPDARALLDALQTMKPEPKEVLLF